MGKESSTNLLNIKGGSHKFLGTNCQLLQFHCFLMKREIIFENWVLKYMKSTTVTKKKPMDLNSSRNVTKY